MNQNYLLALIIVIFFILCLVVIFKFDSFKQTFSALGIRFKISGKKKSNDQNNKSKNLNNNFPEQNGIAALKVNGRIKDSSIGIFGATKGELNVKKDIQDSQINLKGGSTKANIGGDIEKSNVEIKTKKNT